ncbi:MAG: hypothetical protein IPK97_14490 [Ahniella sp.]|nr:hypothetical protein [Ahniella sp.]
MNHQIEPEPYRWFMDGDQEFLCSVALAAFRENDELCRSMLYEFMQSCLKIFLDQVPDYMLPFCTSVSDALGESHISEQSRQTILREHARIWSDHFEELAVDTMADSLLDFAEFAVPVASRQSMESGLDGFGYFLESMKNFQVDRAFVHSHRMKMQKTLRKRKALALKRRILRWFGLAKDSI